MIKYDEKYYFNLLKIHTHTAKEICLRRWDFVLQLMPEFENRHPIVLDYGSGVGWFVAFKPEQIKEVDSFDIMPVPQSGILHEHYDIVTMWDVLEHIDWKNEPDKKIEDILTKTDYVATTIPILPLGKDFETWKHNKKNEHLTRFKSLDEVIHFFNKRNFKLKEISSNECPPREDVYSFLFEKIK
jgi:hypothetical protein